MEKTLDSISPADAEGSSGGDMSYLYGRDPSILAYSQRPVPSSKQNLISLYEDEEIEYPEDSDATEASDSCLETVKVYLRMKPFPRKLKLTREETDAYQVTNSTTLVTKLPSLDHTCSFSKGQKNAESICRRFTFTQTFGPETTQLQLFEEIIQRRMVDFLAGQNCTVMTYGTTNSGKSYTLQGTTTSPGIIPRGLEFVFTNINPRPTPCYKPFHHSTVVCLNAVERAQEIEAKNKLLTFASIDKHQYINAYKQMQKLLQEESPIRPSQACDAHYSVWVSFAEIYNENVHDLLSNECQKHRPVLKLCSDTRGRTFIKGLRTICVNSGSEAYQVLMAGQYNLKVAATALNARSSRSHCIFTIYLLKYYTENTPSSVELSTFAFCDLAGSERLKKTLNVGDRLKEAQNINTSLLVLGRCLKSIYEGQSVRQRQEHVGPFRESKLTRLFQRALSGKEKIALIVNLNPIPNLYIETQNVLNFSAIAKKIVVEPKKTNRKISNSRFSQIVAQSAKSNTDWDPTELPNLNEQTSSEMANEASVFIHHEDYEDLVDENDKLRKEIGALKASMLNKDLQTRQELADTYTAMMEQLEADWKNRIRDVEEQQEDNLQWSINRVETFYKQKLNELTSRKRRRQSESFSDDNCDLGELEMENTRLTGKIQSLKKTIKTLRDNNETVLTEKNKISFELGLANDELKSLKTLLGSAQTDLYKDDESLAYVEELRNQLNDKQARIKKLKEFLNEAKMEYIAITSDITSMEKQLKQRDEALCEREERVADLEELLDQTNVCLAEKTALTERLEEKVNKQSSMLLELEDSNRNTESKLMETIKSLTEKIATLESKISSEKIVKNSSLADIEIKEEILSEPEVDVSTEFTKQPVTPGIVIKTDSEEIFDIPSTSYEDDRESEVFVQIQEVSFNPNVSEDKEISPEGETVIELQIKLNDCKSKNNVMERKLSQSFEEIQSLRESLHLAKEKLNDITKSIRELKDRQDSETRMRENSLAMKIRETKEIFCQTDETKYDEKSVQTLSVENDELMRSEKLLNELRLKFVELEAKYQAKQLSHDEQAVKMISLTQDLASARAERERLENTLHETEEVRKRLNIQISECHQTHQPKIMSLEKELLASNKREATQTECIKAHKEKITKLESAFTAQIEELEKDLVQANKHIENYQTEKTQLDQRMADNLREMEALQNRIQVSEKRDQEKDEEIRQLQKSIKTHLSAEIQEKKSQDEIKRNLKELLETREALARTDELYKRLSISSKKEIEALEAQISILEKNGKSLETLQQKAQHDKADIERLRTERDELKNVISQKEREMEAFMANRDTMIKKYEDLLKHNQEESERAKREVTRFQELFHKLPTTPRGKICKSEEDHKDPIPVVDLSNSETKRTTRRGALAPPPTETKRSTRKKKLYMPVDDSCVDLETCEAIPPTPSPSTSTRSLRNRKK